MVLATNCGLDFGIAGEQAAAVGKARGDIENPDIPSTVTPQHSHYGEVLQNLSEQFLGDLVDIKPGTIKYFDTNADCKGHQPAE